MGRMKYLSNEFIVHPGETVKELVSIHFTDQKGAARMMGISQKQLSLVINCKANVTNNFAYRLAKAIYSKESEKEVVSGYQFLTNLQRNYEYDLMKAEELKHERQSN